MPIDKVIAIRLDDEEQYKRFSEIADEHYLSMSELGNAALNILLSSKSLQNKAVRYAKEHPRKPGITRRDI